jgi:hypothetical protein
MDFGKLETFKDGNALRIAETLSIRFMDTAFLRVSRRIKELTECILSKNIKTLEEQYDAAEQ